jgi:hypothetical protein
MPFDDPEPSDPSMLVGVAVPGGEAATREMVAAFADEFAQVGLGRDQILKLFRNPFYGAAHAALKLLGEDEVGRIVDESSGFWSRYRVVVHDRAGDPAAEIGLVRRGGFLKVIQ